MKDTIARARAGAVSQAQTSNVIDVSAGSQALASSAARAFLAFNGALSADAVITLPLGARVQKIRNDTTGAYKLSVRRGTSGAAIIIPQNETIEVR